MAQNNADSSVKLTKDGSTTIYSGKFDQHYHNPNGAVSESSYVFFDVPGVLDRIKQNREIQIFEMGFGTGLNLLLADHYLTELKSKSRIVFNSVEAFPIDAETVSHLNFGDKLNLNRVSDILESVFSSISKGVNQIEISENLDLNLYYGFFDDMPSPAREIDFFFHDPFSPEVNSELWTAGVFSRLKEMASADSVLTTYCAASSARASMAVAGWNVAKTRGALGKREMTIASPDEKRLKGFKRVNEQRLIERYKAGDFISKKS